MLSINTLITFNNPFLNLFSDMKYPVTIQKRTTQNGGKVHSLFKPGFKLFLVDYLVYKINYLSLMVEI